MQICFVFSSSIFGFNTYPFNAQMRNLNLCLQEGTQMSKRAARVGGSALLREIQAIQMEEEEKARLDRVTRIAKMANDVQAVHGRQEEGRGGRSGRGLLHLFEALSDLRTDSSLIRGGNSTGDERGILDFVADVATSLLGGASDKNDAPVLIPNHCW